ncbi:MAG: hypothetical protein O7G30_18365 [Proteobacteria bacterium]|nr:hypothetical protein [Pseudomonadota bacterium]
MRRRFGRRRARGPDEDGRAPIDAARIMQRIIGEGVIAAVALEPVDPATSGVPEGFAALGSGEAQDGTALVVAFTPRDAGDALLGALAEAARRAEADGFAGEAIAVAPQWSVTARRRLGLVGELSFRFRALAAPALGDGATVEPEPMEAPSVLTLDQVAGHLTSSADRELFVRASVALEGLASKHGGALRGTGRSVELVLLARRVAELCAGDDGVVLNGILPQRSSDRLSAEDLPAALDKLEGNLRRRLNDRRARDGEDGLRTRVIPLVLAAQSLRASVPWPMATGPGSGSDAEVLDLAGVDASGRTVVAAVRQRMDLAALSAVLDAAARIRATLPMLLAHAGPPLRLDAPRLVLAAESYEASVARVLPLLTLPHELLEIRSGRGRELAVASISAGDAARARPVAARSGDGDGERAGSRSRGRGRGRGRSRGDAGERAEPLTLGPPVSQVAPPDEGEAPAQRFEEISFFDLQDDRSDEGGDGGQSRGRSRGRGRRRGRRGGGGEHDSEAAVDAEEEETPDDIAAAAESDDEPVRRPDGPARPGGRRGREGGEPRQRHDEDEDADGPIELEEVPELEGEIAEPRYEEDEDLGEAADPEQDRLALEREKRRRARLAKASPEPVAPEPPKPPRRRAAILAHADPHSILAGIVLARDIRLLEGFWVYPQEELMTFFRSVTTDLREGTPIFVIGFTPSPARDVVQTAALYSDRLIWFDHHAWPPEDLGALRQTIGEENVHVTPGTESSLSAVLAECTRRSRFTDKVVDLATSRFTQHDYERWGRLWSHRLSEMVRNPGEKRGDIAGLLAGRPSDLAKEAAKLPSPPLPEELRFVSERDFRLVHFAGYALVVIEVPPELDLHLCARIARERYGAALSLACRPGEELAVFSGDDASARRSLDYGALAEHLADKLEWVELLPDDDHVARFRVRELPTHPERLNEVIGEIAMGRSILEG